MAVNNTSILSTPTLTVDNTVLPIQPNSLSYNEGLGTDTVRAQSSGGGSVQLVHAKNVETAVSTVKCQVENTQANIEFIRAVKASGAGTHVLSFFDNATGFVRTVQQATLTNDPEVGLGADTPIALEFMGASAV